MGIPAATAVVSRTGRTVCITLQGVHPRPDARLRVRGRVLLPTSVSVGEDPCEICFHLPCDGPAHAVFFFWTAEDEDARDFSI